MSVAFFDTIMVNVLHVKGDADANRFLPRRTTATPAGVGEVPIGGVVWSPFALTDPNYLLLNGQTVPTMATDFPTLYALNGSSTTLPDWRNFSPMGAGATVAIGATAGATTNSLTSAQLAAHTHTGAAHVHGSGGGHVHSGPAHTHTVSGLQNSNLTAGASPVNVPGGSTNTGSDGTENTGNTDPGNTASTTPGAGGSTGSGNTFSILSPVVGANPYVRAA